MYYNNRKKVKIMKGKLNKFGLSLAVLFAVAFSSFSMADDMKKL